MPYALSRQTFKSAQRTIEHSSTSLTKDLSLLAKSAPKATPETTLANLDALIGKAQTLKRKLESLHDEEQKLNASSAARIAHLEELYAMESLADVKYETWSRTRLSRLLVDYLLRSGYIESAAHLSRAKNISSLVDVDAFISAHKIEASLREGRSVTQALNWCKENGSNLKKVGGVAGTLEFELRLQQYVELVRKGHEAMHGVGDGEGEDGDMRMVDDEEDLVGEGDGGVALEDRRAEGARQLAVARDHAKKWLIGSGGNVEFEVVGKAAGLLAYKPWDRVEPYAVCPFLFYDLISTRRCVC